MVPVHSAHRAGRNAGDPNTIRAVIRRGFGTVLLGAAILVLSAGPAAAARHYEGQVFLGSHTRAEMSLTVIRKGGVPFSFGHINIGLIPLRCDRGEMAANLLLDLPPALHHLVTKSGRFHTDFISAATRSDLQLRGRIHSHAASGTIRYRSTSKEHGTCTTGRALAWHLRN
jgi:hypothetical protein